MQVPILEQAQEEKMMNKIIVQKLNGKFLPKLK